MSENQFLHWLQQSKTQAQTIVGIGDDAAITSISEGQRLVSCTDTLLEGVHFLLDSATLKEVGYKALAVNLSDIAAMGARPLSFLVSLTVPRSFETEQLQRIYSGFDSLIEQFEMDLIGGDTTSWDGKLAISVTVLGETQGEPWLRSGAQVGDRLVLSGPLGGSLLGHHLRFKPRIGLANQLRKRIRVNAAIDISDGLAIDLTRLLTASGKGGRIDATKIPITNAAKEMSRSSEKTPLDHALSDGEDFELLLAIPEPDLAQLRSEFDQDTSLFEIGYCTEGEEIILQDGNGNEHLVKPSGFQHQWGR